MFLLLLVFAQPPIPGGPPKVPDGPPPIKRTWPTGSYVLFVKTEERGVGGHVTFRNDNAYEQPGIYWITAAGAWRLHGDPDVAIREVSQPALPFSKRSGELRSIADDDRTDPRFADILSGLQPYTTATKTQTTFRRVVGFIRPESRLTMPNKWNVPGHLDGITGWSSRLYKNASAQVFLVRQDPLDTVSAVTWGRSYPDGTTFADVLRGPTGEVFEVRLAQKRVGEWERFVAFTDANHRPKGYVRPTSNDCKACHREPGVSAYGGSAIPGGDSIFSDPFDVLESGRVVQGGNGTSL